MKRLVLIHWNAGEGRGRLELLRGAGYEAEYFTLESGTGLRGVRENPPDGIVIDLSRLPLQGRAVAIELRKSKATRGVPLVFAGGPPEKVERVRELLPDAAYTEWDGIGDALARALARVPENPVVPGTMDGYAGTPLPKKLGIRAGASVALLGAPKAFETTLGAMPEGVRLVRHARGRADLILLFVRSHADLHRRFAAAERALNEGGGLWIVWPKKASGINNDLTQAGVRKFGLANGMVDYKICAVDQTWSGLLFARRR